MASTYIEHKFNLSDNQRGKLGKAIKNKTSLKIRLSTNNLQGGIPLLLTKMQKANVLKAINNKNGIDLNLSKTQLDKLTKHGGFLPLLPLILGGISAIGSLAAGSSQIAKAVNQAKTNAQQLLETKRHNELMEAKMGTGAYKKCNKCNGKGLFLAQRPMAY